MAYIGRQNLSGAYRQLDDISSGFDGSDTTHSMQVNSANVTVGDVNQILLSLGGVIQKPGTDFTVSGSVLTFTTAPAANTSFFAILLGSDNGGTVTPTDGSVTAAKVASSGAFAIGASGTASSLAGITFYQGQSGSIYTVDVSGTDDSAENNTAFGAGSMGAVTTGDNNTAMGENALGALNTGADNVAIGFNAGSSATSGSYSVMIGRNAGAANNSRLTAVGYYAGAASTGIGGTYMGFNAGSGNTSGTYNTALGYNALYQPDTEGHNTAVGYAAAGGPIAGAEYNSSFGAFSLDALTSGDQNACYGSYSGTAVTTGYGNTFLGTVSGESCTVGNHNVCVGNDANLSNNNESNAIVIGQNISGVSNDFSFGKASNVVSNTFDSDANWSRSSDVRKKRNIHSQGLGLDFINDLRTVRFQWKPSNEFPKEWNDYSEENTMNLDVIMHGFIAQEVKETLDKHASEDDKKFSGWKEGEDGMQHTSREMFVIPLIKAVQELSAQVEDLKAKLEDK